MSTHMFPSVPVRRASQVLIALFGQLSIFRHQNIRIEFPKSTPNFDMLASIEFFGRSHTLACAFRTGDSRASFESSVAQLRRNAAELDKNIHPVFVAPLLSTTEQEFCRGLDVDYFDLCGNARIRLGEIFIALQTFPCAGLPERKPEDIWKLPPEFSERPANSNIQSVA